MNAPFFRSAGWAFLLAALPRRSGCGGDPKDVTVSIEAPAMVKVGDRFTLKAVVKNTGAAAQKLVDLDISEAYLKGFVLEKSEPAFTEATHVPIDDKRSYTFNKAVAPGEEASVVFKAV